MVGRLGLRRVVLDLGRAQAAERALVEDEDLDVLAPAERPVGAVRRAVGDWHVLAERLHARRPDLLDRARVLRAEDRADVARLALAREVVDELVVVPLVVDRAGGPELHVVPVTEDLAIARALLGERKRAVRRLGAVGVDRVAEVDVEVVLLGHHALEGRHVGRAELVEVEVALRVLLAAVVTADREADRRRGARLRRSQERPEHAALAALVEEEVVAVPRRELGDAHLHGQVVRLGGDQALRDALAREAGVLGDLDLQLAGLRRTRPQQRRGRGDLGRGDAVGELRGGGG